MVCGLSSSIMNVGRGVTPTAIKYIKKRRPLPCASSPSKAFALPGAQTDGLKATLLRFPTNVLGLWTVVPRRPLPLAQVAPPATGGAPIAPQLRYTWIYA